jgi:hypothetical protein
VSARFFAPVVFVSSGLALSGAAEAMQVAEQSNTSAKLNDASLIAADYGTRADRQPPKHANGTSLPCCFWYNACAASETHTLAPALTHYQDQKKFTRFSSRSQFAIVKASGAARSPSFSREAYIDFDKAVSFIAP